MKIIILKVKARIHTYKNNYLNNESHFLNWDNMGYDEINQIRIFK